MNADLDTLATRLYVTIDDLLKDHPHWQPERPEVGITPQLSDAELITLAVIQALLGYTSERRFIRYAHSHLHPWFPYLPQRAAYNKRLRAAGNTIQHIITYLARDCPSYTDDVWLVDSTPVECGRSRETAKRSDMAGYASYGYCASHSRLLWGLRLHLVATPSGLPVAYGLTSAKTDERDTALAMFIATRSCRTAPVRSSSPTRATAPPPSKPCSTTPGSPSSDQQSRPKRSNGQANNSSNRSARSSSRSTRPSKHNSISNATAAANQPVSAPASSNESSPSPPPSGTTKPPTNPAPHAHSSPTTTNTPPPTPPLGANHLGAVPLWDVAAGAPYTRRSRPKPALNAS